MAASVPGAASSLPADRQARIEAACRKLPDTGRKSAPSPPGTPSFVEVVLAKPPRQAEAESRLTELRTVRLTGPVVADLTEDVLLLADGGGRVERVSNLSKKNAKAFERQVTKLGPIRLSLSRPDQEPFKAVRRALLACSTLSGCALVLDLPGLQPLSTKDLGSIRIVRIDPKEGAELVRGQRVTLTATVRYDLNADEGMVALVIQNEAGRSLTDTLPAESVAGPSGEITLTGTFTVPGNATRIDVLLPLHASLTTATTTVTAAHYAVKLQ